MNNKELISQIENALHTINVGDTFPTQTSLYRALGLPIGKDGNKTLKKFVSLYIEWETISDNPKSKRRPKKIRITKINPVPLYCDGRINNGGARNNKYGNIIKPLLLRYDYPEVITYSTIFSDIYGFSSEAFNIHLENSIRYEKRESEKHYRNCQKYKNYVCNYLKQRTNTALDGLQREGFLEYKNVYAINGNAEILPDNASIEFNKSSLLTDFLRKVFVKMSDAAFSDFIICFENAMNICNKNSSAYISITNLSLFDFIKLCVKKNSPIDIQKIKELYKRYYAHHLLPIQKESVHRHTPNTSHTEAAIASPEQEAIVTNAEEIVSSYFGFTRQSIGFDYKKQRAVYSWTSIIYMLIGWKSVFKGLCINVDNKRKIEALDSYPVLPDSFQALCNILEPQIVHWCTGVTFNPYRDGELKKPVTPRRALGKKTGTDAHAVDFDYAYLAHDCEVSILHCKIFSLEGNKEYLWNRYKELQEN